MTNFGVSDCEKGRSMRNYKQHNILCKELIEQEAKDICKNALLFVLVVVGLVWVVL